VPGTTREERPGTGKLRNRENEVVVSGARKGRSLHLFRYFFFHKNYVPDNIKSQTRVIDNLTIVTIFIEVLSFEIKNYEIYYILFKYVTLNTALPLRKSVLIY